MLITIHHSQAFQRFIRFTIIDWCDLVNMCLPIFIVSPCMFLE